MFFSAQSGFFSSNTGKVHFEGLVQLFIYIRYNNNLGLKYYAKIEYAPLSDLLIQAGINTENRLVVFSDSRYQDCPDTGRSTGAYILFYQGVTIDNFTHVPGPVAQSSAEIMYNAVCTAVMALAHFRMLNKEPDVVPEQSPIIILDRKSDICMAKNGKYTKHTIHISRRIHFLRNG